jgi:uncharacterized protein YjbI with pentapeptide repeats
MTELTQYQIYDLLNRPGPLWLFGIDLAKASLSGADLSGAKYNNDTQWPDGFDPVAAGAEKVD